MTNANKLTEKIDREERILAAMKKIAKVLAKLDDGERAAVLEALREGAS
jgi:hypothetical protein